jgi:hypothetical protein
MLTRWADGNISVEATTQSGNIFPEATRTPVSAITKANRPAGRQSGAISQRDAPISAK